MPPNSSNPEVHPVGTEQSKHIDMLVTNQQINSSRKRGGSSRRDVRNVRPPRRRLASANPLPVNRQTNQMSDTQTHHQFDGKTHQSVDRHSYQVNRPIHHQDNRQNHHPIDRQTHHPIDRQTHHLIDRQQHHPVYRQSHHPVNGQTYFPIDEQIHHPVGIPADHKISTQFDVDFLQNIVWELIKKVAKSKSVS